MARRATAIEQIRQQVQGPILLLDCGNTLFGKPPSNESQGGVQILAMNAMGYDAMALGEIDLGAEAAVLSERFQEADFPILSVNVGPAGVLPIQPYLLREMEGHTVAIIGATVGKARERAGVLGVTLEVEGGLDAVQRTVEEVRDQADIIIILSNLNPNTNQKLAEQIPGIDAIIGARDGGNPAQPMVIEGPEGRVVIHLPLAQGKALAKLTLNFDAQGKIVTYEGRSISLSDQYADDPEMVQLLQEYRINP